MKPRSFFYPSILYVNVLTLLLCLIGTVGTMLWGPNIPILQITDWIIILALGIAALYVLRGTRKQDVRYLRGFLLICTAAEAAGLWGSTFLVTNRFFLVLPLLRLLVYLFLALKHDLGREFSLLLSVCTVLLSILSLIVVLIGYQRILLGGILYSAYAGFRAASMLELSIIALLCVWFKYQDKEARKRALLR